MALTDTKVRSAKPEAKEYSLVDGDGMFLLIHPKLTDGDGMGLLDCEVSFLI